MIESVAVFCGSSKGNDQRFADQAYNVGKFLAEEGISLVYGAAKIGLMGCVANGVLDHHGKAIGIIPEFLMAKEIVHEALNELIVTDNMHDRKVKIYERSDAFMILPGGFGTMDEFFEITTWGQLGLHTKPIGILNVDGFYDPLLAQANTMITSGLLKAENMAAVQVDETPSDLITKMRDYSPKPVKKWLDHTKL